MPSGQSVGARRHVQTSAQALKAAVKDSEPQQDKKRQKWELGRFVKTLAFFTAPRPITAVRKRLQNLGKGSSASSLPADTVLVTDVETDLGSAVVKQLLAKGVRVRGVTADRAAALRALAIDDLPAGLELVTASWSDSASLRPSHFSGVTKAVVCSARPEGLSALTDALQRYSDLAGKIAYSSAPGAARSWDEWGSLDDVVMGGVSTSGLAVVAGEGESAVGRSAAAVFSGTVKDANNGGFSSVRTRGTAEPMDWSGYDAVALRVKGDGFRYKFTLYDQAGWDRPCWIKSFDTEAGIWADVVIPFSELRAIYRSKTVTDPKPLDLSTVHSLQLMLSKFEYDGALNPNFQPGEFKLVIDSIKAVRQGQGARTGTPALVYAASDARQVQELSVASKEGGVASTVVDASKLSTVQAANEISRVLTKNA